MSFVDLGLSDEVLRAIGDAGYTEPTPIQEQAIPVVFMGRDILGCAQTGTGKTAGFTLPMIDILAAGKAKTRMPRSLILEPTRELAAQVAESFDTYGKYNKLNKALLIGGHTMNEQIRTIDKGVDVLIATPGRLLDLFDRGHLLMHDVKILVIDEADRMLDMGFIPDVEKIVGMLPKIRNTLFFSATMPPEIRRLADKFLINPKEISVAPPSTTAETITQGLLMVNHRDGKRPGGGQKEKREALRKLIKSEKPRNALIFCNRKRDVDTVCKSLNTHGIEASRLHGDMSQPARTETLAKFKSGDIKIVVCSDVAARGLDIPDMSHVFNFDVPIHAEDYVHRIGRTGRAGRKGHAYTIATPEDAKYLAAIKELAGNEIPLLKLDGIVSGSPKSADDAASTLSTGGRDGGRGGRGGRDRRPSKPAKAPEPKSPEAVAPATAAVEAVTPVAADTKAAPTEPVTAESIVAEPVAAEPVKAEAVEKLDPVKKQDHAKTKNAPDGNNNDTGNAPVKGLGDHMPAFLLNSAPKGKSK